MQIVSMQQVHGGNVVKVGKKDIGKVIPDCDALITNEKGVTLQVSTADCLPISVKDKNGKAVGLIHAGWRGLEARVIKRTIYSMTKEYGVNIADLRVSIGPHICADDYEVKGDVSFRFDRFEGAVLTKGEKQFLDLAVVAQTQLIRCGVKKENIEVSTVCTFENKDYFSYRRDKTDKRNLTHLTLGDS